MFDFRILSNIFSDFGETDIDRKDVESVQCRYNILRAGRKKFFGIFWHFLAFFAFLSSISLLIVYISEDNSLLDTTEAVVVGERLVHQWTCSNMLPEQFIIVHDCTVNPEYDTGHDLVIIDSKGFVALRIIIFINQ